MHRWIIPKFYSKSLISLDPLRMVKSSRAKPLVPNYLSKICKLGKLSDSRQFSDLHDENLIFILCLLPSITQGVFYQWLDFHDFFLLFDPYLYFPNLARFHCKVILNLSALSWKLKLVVIVFLSQLKFSPKYLDFWLKSFKVPLTPTG